jgi:hypothetical protein
MSKRMLGRLLAVCGIAAGSVITAASASAGTWYISPTVTNHSSGALDRIQYGISDGSWLIDPAPTLSLGGGSDTYQFDAPHLDEGADASVTYNMPDTTQMTNLSQDDVNGGFSDELAAPTCALPDPTGPWPQYSCAAGFGNQGLFNPSNSDFRPQFNFYNSGSNAPAGATPAPFTAAGQECNSEMTPGNTTGCTSSQPSLTGFSPVDPYNYENLTFYNQGQYPVTITITDPYFQSLYARYPKGCLYDPFTDPDQSDCQSASESVTLPAWSTTTTLQTFGGANSNLCFFQGSSPPRRSDTNRRPDTNPVIEPCHYGGVQDGPAAVSDQISISPGPGAPTGPAWYGVEVYVQSEIGPHVQDGESLASLLAGIWTAFESTYNSPLYENGGDEGTIDATASLRPGKSLASGRSIASGPYHLTMKASGNLVEDVRVNRRRFAVWSSGTKASDSRLVLQRDGNLVIRTRRGVLQWSTHTHGARVTSLNLQSDGNLVLRSRSHRALFATGRVSYPFRAWPGAKALGREMGLAPGDQLRVGMSRLRMNRDGNLVLLRAGRRRWASGTRGHPGAYADLRHGNLVVASPHGKILWSTRTGGRGTRLTLSPSGRIALLSRAHKQLWSAPRPRH